MMGVEGTDTDTGNDPFHLQRFAEAQASVYPRARAELAAGEKRSHWMWFIFPQIAGLGSSPMAQRYALSGLPEAGAYLRHPVLGARLRECTGLVLAVPRRMPGEIFGYPDDLKFHSSVTLFAEAAAQDVAGDGGDDGIFADALAKYFGGQPDAGTLRLLQR